MKRTGTMDILTIASIVLNLKLKFRISGKSVYVKLKWLMLLITACVLCIWWMNVSSFFSSLSSADKQYDPSSGNTLASTPPMGWNSWNFFRCQGLNESVVRAMADALVAKGLAQAGYIYVNLDDCWQIDRNASGYIVEDPKKFPSGMKALGDYLHKKGLKFGIYTNIGSLTCEKRPGSLHHEQEDVESYSSWGVDYIKSDDCWLYPGMTSEQHYARFSHALLRAPRPIMHSIKGSVPVKSAAKYGQIRRVGSDVYHEWGSVISLVDKVVSERLWESGRPGLWHDIDMLEVGNGDMTEDENVCHMILWCAFKSPLLLGNDLRSITASTLSLLSHSELLAINQDPKGRMVELVWQGRPDDNKESSSGGATERVVSAPCDVKDTAQQWRVEGSRLESVAHKKMCLAAREGIVKDRLIAAIAKCDSKDPMQQWRINEASQQLELVGVPGKCLTTNTQKGINAHIRGCKERQSIPPYKGPNQSWFYFNDAFDFIHAGKIGNGVLLFKNSANKCPRVGDHEELQIFTGPLADNRAVAVLLNRDENQHKMTLHREHFESAGVRFPRGATIQLRDAYLGDTLGSMTTHYPTSVPPHGAKMIVASIAEKTV